MAYLCVITALFLSVVWHGMVRGLLKREEETGSGNAVDWSLEYPFEEQEPATETADPVQGERASFLSGYEQKVDSAKASLEWYCTDGFYLQPQCVELSAFANRIFGTKIIQSADRLVSVHGGYLTAPADRVDTVPYAANVAEFAEFLSEEEIPFLYVESLFKAERNDDDPLLYDDYSNRNADELVGYLRDAGISVLDLRDSVSEQGMDHYALFFRTDTHWLPSTGLWASRQIAERLQSEFSFDFSMELLSEERYRSVFYPQSYLGSSGRNAGLSYAGLDDFTLLLPDFETSLTYRSREAGIHQSGNFDEALIDWDRLESTDYYANSSYAAYMGGRQPLAEIYNAYADNGVRLLFLSDSFGATVAPFLALTVSELDFIDLRLFNGSIENYIRLNPPDAVVMMYNPEVITSVSPDSNDSIYMLR
ncbi:MAG: DHHW family protein [Clostridium sp.]|nr:DHHW family protein [Clostridium sp.]